MKKLQTQGFESLKCYVKTKAEPKVYLYPPKLIVSERRVLKGLIELLTYAFIYLN